MTIWHYAELTRLVGSISDTGSSNWLKRLGEKPRRLSLSHPPLAGHRNLSLSSQSYDAGSLVFAPKTKEDYYSRSDLGYLHVHQSRHGTTITDRRDSGLYPKHSLQHIEERLQSLRNEYGHILELEESLSQGQSLTKEEEEVLSTMPSIYKCLCLLEALVEPLNPSYHGVTVSTGAHAVFDQEMTSMNENMGKEMVDTVELEDKIVDQVEPGDKERYLCISNGFTICCLDLEQSQDEPNACCSGMQKIPTKISTIKLLAEGFPFSLGLFRSGSHAYMVGGQEFPGFKDSDLLNLKVFPSDLEIFRFLHEKYGGNGDSSSKIYLMTLLADSSLSLSKHSNIKSSNKPKSWPIVEKIDDYIHVIECLPSLDRLEIPSHEVIDLNDPSGDWIERSAVRSPDRANYIRNHLVVGHRIYARDSRSDFHDEFVVYDFETSKWENHMYPSRFPGRIYIKHAAEILGLGFGSCIGEFPSGDSKDPLYVVLAVGRYDKLNMLAAVAFLVTKAGQVLCFQRLNRFFEGFNFKELIYVAEGTVVCGGDQGKTMCSILRRSGTNTLFITTFRWKQADDALGLVSSLLSEKKRVEDDVEKWKESFTEEEDFVEVVGTGWYVSQFGLGMKSVFKADFVPTRLSACFL